MVLLISNRRKDDINAIITAACRDNTAAVHVVQMLAYRPQHRKSQTAYTVQITDSVMPVNNHCYTVRICVAAVLINQLIIELIHGEPAVKYGASDTNAVVL